MTRFLLIVLAALALALGVAVIVVDCVTDQRDEAVKAAEQGAAAVASLRGTLALQRELATDQAAIETTYLTEKQRAEDYAESLRTCLADGTCGLRVAATCERLPVDGAAAAAVDADASAPRLTAAAERAYPALVAGLQAQRAQITGLQDQLITLHNNCKIGATHERD